MTGYETRYGDMVRAVEQELDRRLSTAHPRAGHVVQAMRYSTLGGGKRVRAVLLLQFCQLCAGTCEQALPFAAALEMIHAYSLIHDDLPCMDDDDMRRGKPSCHVQFGEATAVLAGDALLNCAFETMLQETAAARPDEMPRMVRAMQTIAQASGYRGMVGGQMIDLENEGHPEQARQDLLEMYALKTGALLRASVVAGAILGGAEGELLQSAADYAEKIGLAFQIVDDILDVVGDPKALGKPVGSDQRQDKATYVALFGLEKSRAKVDELTEQALQLLDTFPGDRVFLQTLTRRLSDRND